MYEIDVAKPVAAVSLQISFRARPGTALFGLRSRLTLDIAERKQRLDEAANAVGRNHVAWHGDTGDTCPRCHVQAPAGYLLALPGSDVTGCLRCLEMQALLFYIDFDALPADLASSGGQQEAMRTIAQEFRQHIKAVERRRAPISRLESASRWAAQSGWEFSPAWEPPIPHEKSERRANRWPKRPLQSPPPQQPKARKRPPPDRRPRPQPPGPADLLGLTGSPSRAEIIAAFRRSALVCHPDYGGSAEAFRELVAARDALLADA